MLIKTIEIENKNLEAIIGEIKESVTKMENIKNDIINNITLNEATNCLVFKSNKN